MAAIKQNGTSLPSCAPNRFIPIRLRRISTVTWNAYVSMTSGIAKLFSFVLFMQDEAFFVLLRVVL